MGSHSRESSQPRDWTQVSHTAGRFFIISESPEKQALLQIYSLPSGLISSALRPNDCLLHVAFRTQSHTSISRGLLPTSTAFLSSQYSWNSFSQVSLSYLISLSSLGWLFQLSMNNFYFFKHSILTFIQVVWDIVVLVYMHDAVRCPMTQVTICVILGHICFNCMFVITPRYPLTPIHCKMIFKRYIYNTLSSCSLRQWWLNLVKYICLLFSLCIMIQVTVNIFDCYWLRSFQGHVPSPGAACWSK